MKGRWTQLLRLAGRDVRKHPGMGALLFLSMLVATTTFTLALVVRGAAEDPWNHTFALTSGPHIVVTTFDGTIGDTTDGTTGVVATEGPFPLLSMPGEIEVMARDTAPAAVDQPYVVEGTWIREGAVVVEQSYATARGLSAGGRITIAGNDFPIAGIAVTTARQPTPFYTEGLVWATRADASALAAQAESQGEVLMVRLADPAAAPAFAAAHNTGEEPYFDDWQSTRFDAITDVLFALFGLIVGSVSLALLATASVAVLISGRMAAQTRRAALLKAVGATPGYVGLVMLAEYLGFALLASIGGLIAGAWLTPLLASPVSGIVGAAGPADLSPATIALVCGSSLVLAGLATLIPTVRAVRASTMRSLANPARAPRRSRLLIALSRRLPASLLFGLRMVARRPGRTALSAAGLSVTVAAVVVALWMEAGIASDTVSSEGIVYNKLRIVIYTSMAALFILAAVNAILIAWVTGLDNARSAALARALGATPAQIASGFTIAGTLPALAAAGIGIPLGLAVMATAEAAAGGGNSVSPLSAGIFALLPGIVVLVAGLTIVPSRLAARRSVIDALRD